MNFLHLYKKKKTQKSYFKSPIVETLKQKTQMCLSAAFLMN